MSNARFSIIPAWIVTDSRLKGSDLKVLCLLGTYTNKEGWCRRSQVKMAEQLNCGRSTVQDSLNRLSEIGAVEKRRVESADGRDSAHWYRVVLDRAIASNAFSAWDAEDEEEFGPISAANDSTPPAGIPAPPAGSRPAPPAGSGPAPINDTSLTISSNEEERERERDCDEEENPKAIERRFRKWWATWPTYATDTESTTRREWLALTPEQRRACEERTAEYLAAAKASGRKFSKAAATYLAERAWERLGDKPAAARVLETYTPYSRPWSALRLAELSKPVMPLRLTPLEERIIEDKPEKTDLIWRDKREKAGWPEAVKLHEAVRDRRRMTVPAGIVGISQGFGPVKVGGAVWEAWKRLHHDRCWPWLPEPHGLDFVQFPLLPDGIDDLDEAVERALRDFQQKLIEVRGNDDAA